MIDLSEFIAAFARNATTIESLVGGLSGDQMTWQPAAGKWSALMVLCHLLDEEREDFRMRIDYTLHRPDEKWPPIDPEGWAKSRGYNERDPGEVLTDFLAERRRSLEWLRSLDAPDWSASHHHPSGSLSAGDLVLAWLAHDYLHIRQIVKVLYDYATIRSQPFHARYAGDW